MLIIKEANILIIHSEYVKEGGGFDANNGLISDKRQLVLKCDPQERILDPALFGATLQQQMVRSTSSYIMTLRYSIAGNIYLEIIFHSLLS